MLNLQKNFVAQTTFEIIQALQIFSFNKPFFILSKLKNFEFKFFITLMNLIFVK